MSIGPTLALRRGVDEDLEYFIQSQGGQGAFTAVCAEDPESIRFKCRSHYRYTGEDRSVN